MAPLGVPLFPAVGLAVEYAAGKLIVDDTALPTSIGLAVLIALSSFARAPSASTASACATSTRTTAAPAAS
ncbi:MAG TPA: hypothetical protein VM694_04420 [Polyangium sp.]|nr:hypothetical protein [Polyangium sp.]